jgi:Kef-type K+ transport system membrane component KefB
LFQTHVTRQPSRPALLVGYALMIAGTLAGFFAIRYFGEGLVSALPADSRQLDAQSGAAHATPQPKEKSGGDFATAPRATAPQSVLPHVLLSLAAVMVVGRLLGAALEHFGQPPVIGEVLGGILLGPSLLGWIAPQAAAFVLPADVAPYLSVLSQVGVILYMFMVGLEFDTGQLARHGHTAIAISHASITVPFLLAALLALGIYPLVSPPEVSFTQFALFLGVAMSVTAFPVLARILTDRGIQRTPLGVMALTCAATDDVTAWCLLALVVGVAQAHLGGAVTVVLLTFGYIALVALVVRPLLLRFGSALLAGEATGGRLAVSLIAMLLSAVATDWIGVHAIFGAFLLGVVIPHDCGLAQDLPRRLEAVVGSLLLPAFFAYIGMRTQIGLLSGLADWLLAGLIILVATLGKFGGTLTAARLTGVGWRDSASLGILMNTRGLMELLVLNIGLDLGVISPRLFAMLVVMAIVTTLATSPLLKIIGREPAAAVSPLAIDS